MSHTGESGLRRRVTGATAALGGALVFGLAPIAAAPSAHADLFDLDWLGDILGSAADVDPSAGLDSLGDVSGSLAAVDTDFSGLLDQLISQPLQTGFDDWVNSPFGVQVDDAINSLLGQDVISPSHDSLVGSWLFGGDSPSTAAGGPLETDADQADQATVPLTMNGTTQPVTSISVGGGKDIPVVVDTGSNGLVMPWWDIGLDHFSLPTGFGWGAYSGGLNYFFLKFPETVTFIGENGNVTTGTTDVDAYIFGFPTTLSGLFDFPWTLGQFLAPAQADGVLGIGPDAAGPDTTGVPAVVSALPGDLSAGVLFDEPNQQLTFGPSQLTGGITVNGVASSTLMASIDGGTPGRVTAIIDSGGVFGTMPSSVPGASAAAHNGVITNGTEISVFDQDGTPLYSYTTGNTSVGSNGPVVVSGGSMNTGYAPFAQMPVYVGFGSGGPTTTFYPGQ